MSAAIAAPREIALAPEDGRQRSRSGGGRLTLEQWLDRVWEGLHAAGVAECPACAGPMTASSASEGRCRNCGTKIA